MAIPFHKAVSSLESIQSTIENDSHVYRWFVKFISHPAIKKQLSNSEEACQIYTAIGKTEWKKKILFISFLLVMALTYYSKTNYLLLIELPILAGITILSGAHRKAIAKISCELLKMDREAIKLESQTLYQLCENYGTTLNIPTLVDIIARQDDILRRTVIFTCVLTCFIYPVDFWNNWFIIFGSFFLIQTAINTPLVFDHLK